MNWIAPILSIIQIPRRIVGRVDDHRTDADLERWSNVTFVPVDQSQAGMIVAIRKLQYHPERMAAPRQRSLL